MHVLLQMFLSFSILYISFKAVHRVLEKVYAIPPPSLLTKNVSYQNQIHSSTHGINNNNSSYTIPAE
ncbi:unnamed protein product, partial [Didymodactylos carnosus]